MTDGGIRDRVCAVSDASDRGARPDWHAGARREAVQRERSDRRTQRGDRRGVAGEQIEELAVELRIALLDVADDLVDLAGGCARGIVDRHRDLLPPCMGDVLGECPAADDRQRQRTDRGEQPSQHPRAHPQVQAIERRRDDRRERRRLALAGRRGALDPA